MAALTLDLKPHTALRFCASLLFLQTLGLWFSGKMQRLLSSVISSFPPQARWDTSDVVPASGVSSPSAWDTCCPYPGHMCAWWIHWLQSQSAPYEAPTSSWVRFAWELSQAKQSSLLLVYHFPPHYQSTMHKHVLIEHSVKSQLFKQWPSVSYPPCERNQGDLRTVSNT